MDDSRVMGMMDSLWFFSNVVVGFSSPSSISFLGSADCVESIPTATPIKHVEEVISEKGSEPMSPVVQINRKESPPVAGNSVPISPKSDEEPESLKLSCPLVTCSCICGTNKGQQVLGSTRMTLGLDPRINYKESSKLEMEIAEYYSPSPRSATEKVKRKKRSKRGAQRNKRKVFGELDLGFENVKGVYEENCGFNQRFGEDEDQMNRTTMPSIRDDMAMKEHLKSWAHAVACTVR